MRSKIIILFVLFFQLAIANIGNESMLRRGIPFKKIIKRSKNRNIYIKEEKVSIHLNKFKVIEDYDDFMNDDIYLYVITTIGNKVSLNLTNVYRGLDEGDSFYFFPSDRILASEVELSKSTVIVDFGVIEADGEDIIILKQLISDLVEIAPAGDLLDSRYLQAIKAFFYAVANLKDDTRLITDTIIIQKGEGKSFEEYDFIYSGERYWSDYKYLVNFRIFKEKAIEYLY
jgi:hypothetical protein